MRGFVAISILAASLAATACKRQVEETPAPTPAPVAVTPADTPATQPATEPATTAPPVTAPTTMPAWRPPVDSRVARFAGLVGTKPPTWVEHPPQSPMRAANYTVPGHNGAEAAHIVVFYFGPDQGGSIDSNIDNWQTQFEPDENGDMVEPLISRFQAGDMPVTLVEFAGSWMKMGATWYTPDQLFITAIVESPQGNVFIRFAGQTETVETNRPEFMAMVRSLRQE